VARITPTSARGVTPSDIAWSTRSTNSASLRIAPSNLTTSLRTPVVRCFQERFYVRRQRFSRFAGALALALIVGSNAVPARAQAPSQDPTSELHQHDDARPEQEHDGHDMQMPVTARAPPGCQTANGRCTRFIGSAVSGNSCARKRVRAVSSRFCERGTTSLAASDWIMGMAQRNVGPGRVQLRGMFSAEPWERFRARLPRPACERRAMRRAADPRQQHPHDLAMEIAAEYNAPLRGATRWQAYVAPAGEPALGPVAFPHRTSAMPNPWHRFSHHWLDATHISFGVITGGLYAQPLESRRFRVQRP